MRTHANLRTLTVVSLFVPVFAGIGPNPAHAALQDTQTYIKRGEQLLQANDLKGAEAQFRTAVQRAPEDGGIHIRLAQIYIKENDLNAAQAELIAAKRSGVNSEQYDVVLAEVLFRKGELGQLLRDIPAGNRAPQMESTVRTYRGLAELSLGETSDASTMLKDAERLDPKSVTAKIATVRFLLAMPDLPAADRKADEVLAIAPRNSSLLTLKGNIALSRGDAKDALNYFNGAVKEDPNSAEALLARSSYYLGTGDLDHAEQDVKAVKRLGGNNSMVIYLDASIAARRGNYQSADAALAKLRGVIDRFPDGYLLAGIIKYNLKQDEQATDYLTRYIARRPDRSVAYQVLGAIALRQKDADRAITMLNQAIKLAPDNRNAIQLLAEAQKARGDPETIRILEEAKKARGK